ncbi:MAG: TonB-dependent receptor [Flavobacteriaceae bacterium]|nr:TonB-dependent receptor [Flavobacteriaceae bacterium]
MKLIYVLLAILWFSPGLNAQARLSGQVASEDGTPILATVFIPQLEKGTLTNLNGDYSLERIPEGTYDVIFSSLGYTTRSIKIKFDANAELSQDVIMLESAVEMEEVIISTPFHQLQSDNVMRVERVSTEALNRTGAVNLAQGISDIPGVSTFSTGAGIGKPVIRGLSSNRVLTYSQGVRMENQQFGDEHGLGLNGAGVESIEVISGPASLLYGSDALGGVLYLNPERFADPNKTRADGSSYFYSNTSGFNSTVGAKTSGERWKFLVRGASGSFADYKTGNDLRVTNTRYKEYDLKTGIQFQSEKWRSTLRYNFNNSKVGIPEEIGAQSTSKKQLLPSQKIDNHVISWENRYFFDRSNLNLKLGYLFNDRNEFEDSFSDPALRLKLNTVTYDLKYDLPWEGAFETIVGLQGMFQKNQNFGEEILIPNANKTDFGIFATTHYHLKWIDLQAGLRFDTRTIQTENARNPSESNFIPALDRNFSSINMALGAKADLSERLITRLNFASGFRAPNLAELASNGVHEGTNRYEIGNSGLKNEQNFQIDASLEYRNEHIELFANTFLNSIKDYIFIEPTGEVIDDTNVFNYVQNGATLYGGELGMHVHPHPLDWLHLESSFELVRGDLKTRGSLPLIPANNLQNTFRIELDDGHVFKSTTFFIRLDNTFAQDQVSFFETETAGYNLWSLGGGSQYHLKDFQIHLGLSITNLSNENYIAHLSRLKPDGIANPGRSININIKATL